MILQDWWDEINWQSIGLSQWTSTHVPLDWQYLWADNWQKIRARDWGTERAIAPLTLKFPPVSLESLGITQDSDYVYLSLTDLLPSGLAWQDVSDRQWQELDNWPSLIGTQLGFRWSDLLSFQWQGLEDSQWRSLTGNYSSGNLSADQLFYLLILKLQASQLPAHQVKITGNLAVVESRAWVVSDFNPDNY